MTAIQQKRLLLQNLPVLLKELKEKNEIGFTNEAWIMKNEFESVVGFPLLYKETTVGTLSLYSGYRYDPDSIDFVQGVADLLGSFIFNSGLTNTNPNLERTNDSHQLVDSSILESRFRELSLNWKRDTRFLSSISQISMHPSYQRIIGLGPRVVPLIIEELRNNSEPTIGFGL